MKTLMLFVVFILLLVSYLVYFNFRKKRMGGKGENTPSHSDAISNREQAESERQKAIERGECCGQHEVCERDSLINTRLKAEYYDDEELDIFKGRNPESYTTDEIKAFEEVFYTLKEYDINGWFKSLQIRNVEPPTNIRDAGLMILQERRFKTSSKDGIETNLSKEE